jgi:hypothetical protein
MVDQVSDDAYYMSADHHLRNLLAVIHRDGGHHCEKNGMEASTKRAMEIVGYIRNEDNACLRKQIMGYRDDLEMCRKVFFYIKNKLKDSAVFETTMVRNAADRCLKELKQK